MDANNGLIRIAVDAMGGDYGPIETVKGAIKAVTDGDVQVSLVGDTNLINAELAKHEVTGLPIQSVHAEDVIQETEQPAIALRQKPKSSIMVSTGMVKKGLADASVTMGSTGAAMAAGALVLGVTKGIERPAIGGPILGMAPHTVIVDLGTNVDCRPQQLLSFAIIGEVFARQFWEITRPRVALLSVGSEAGKGNRQVRETTALLEKSGLNFIGNVEANELPYNKTDVAVCDGFVGNVVMKLAEGLGSSLSNLLETRLAKTLPGEDLKKLTKEVFEMCNITEVYGGGPLFGVNGVSIIGHGRGTSESVRRAIETAKRMVDVQFIAKLNEELVRIQQRVDE